MFAMICWGLQKYKLFYDFVVKENKKCLLTADQMKKDFVYTVSTKSFLCDRKYVHYHARRVFIAWSERERIWQWKESCPFLHQRHFAKAASSVGRWQMVWQEVRHAAYNPP